MANITVNPTITEQANGMKNSKEARTEAYLNLSSKEAHLIVEEAVNMLETFLLHHDKVNMDLHSLGGIVRHYEDANEIVQALLTLNKYKKMNVKLDSFKERNK